MAQAATTAPAAAQLQQWWTQAWRRSTRQDRYEITRIEGEIPRELNGTLFRNGPSQHVLPEGGEAALHLFDGDGLVHAFRFENGRVFYAGRFVENPTHVAEREAGRFCLNSLNVCVDDPTPDVPMRQQPNTNIVWHAGHLMAMVENAPPFEIDPATLGPVGEYTFGTSLLGMSVSAHPKIDGRTGELAIHGYQPVEPYVQYYAVDRDGRCTVAQHVDAPFPAMMHDIAITEHYAVLILPPVYFDFDTILQPDTPTAEALQWQPERGLHFGILPRAGGAVRWLRAPTPAFIFHPGNAYEDGNRIVLDACSYLQGGALLDSLRTWRRGEVQSGWHANPFLYEIDLDRGTVSERQLDDRGAEFPRLDDRLVGYRNRWGYAARNRGGGGAEGDVWSTIVKYDREGGPTLVHDFGVGHWPGEPVFVPRHADADEDDGFVLTVVADGPNDASYLAVLDARHVDDAPLAIAHLEHRIPLGFHGNFVAGLV